MIENIELENEEELLEQYQPLLRQEVQRRGAFNDSLRRRQENRDRLEKGVINFYRRVKKHNCVIIRHPSLSRYGYLRGKVRYPDGRERRWWCYPYGASWRTDGP